MTAHAQVAHWLVETDAAIVQPTVLPAAPKGRAGRAFLSRSQQSLSGDCVARSIPFIEQMTPIFRQRGFGRFWAALREMPDARLASDSGLETLWCGLNALHEPERPACVLLVPLSVVHMNTHTIRRFDANERQHYFNRSVNLLPYLATQYGDAIRAARRTTDAIASKGQHGGRGRRTDPIDADRGGPADSARPRVAADTSPGTSHTNSPAGDSHGIPATLDMFAWGATAVEEWEKRGRRRGGASARTCWGVLR